MKAAGVDVGGTNVTAGVVDDGHRVLETAKVPTPTDGPEALADAIAELLGGFDEEASAVAVGIPGGVHDGRITFVPNLDGWNGDEDFREMLADRIGPPLTLVNDVDIGLIGEWVAGAAQDQQDVLGVWMGTGIGGALILSGQPYRGSLGGAGELGHVVVQAGGALCTCGRRGCVEAYAGRRSMARAIETQVKSGRSTSLFEIQRKEGKPRPTSKVWQKALEQGDELATEAFDGAIRALGAGIGSAVNLIGVSRVIIGGGMAEKLGQPLADRLREAADPWMLRPNPDLEFRVAELGDDSGVVGGAAVARSALIAGEA